MQLLLENGATGHYSFVEKLTLYYGKELVEVIAKYCSPNIMQLFGPELLLLYIKERDTVLILLDSGADVKLSHINIIIIITFIINVLLFFDL